MKSGRSATLASYFCAVAFAKTSSFGVRSFCFASTLAKGGTASATISEWNAVATGSMRAFRPSASHSSLAFSTMSCAPDRTTWSGPLSLASTRPWPIFFNTGAIVSESVWTANMAPLVLPAALAMSAPRSAATVRAVSESITPARCRAMISPKLWPAAMSACKPSCDRRPNCDKATAAMAGWACCISVSVWVCAPKST